MNRDYEDFAIYGKDTVTLGDNNHTRMPASNAQIVACLQTFHFYTGMFGLGSQPVNITESPNNDNSSEIIQHPSLLATLKAYLGPTQLVPLIVC